MISVTISSAPQACTNHLLVEFVIRFHLAPFYIRYKDGCIVAFVGIFGDLI